MILWRLTWNGKKSFPHLAAKRFEVREHPHAKQYVMVRVVGTKRWSCWSSQWFMQIKPKDGAR